VTLALTLALTLLAAFVLASAVHFGHHRRVWHLITSHPPESQWEGDYTGGCTVGPRACGAMWDREAVR